MPTLSKKRRRQRRPSDRRQQILDAALNCFLESGFASTTMAHIRAASGASHGSIYHFFDSKEAIALELYERGMLDYLAGMERVALACPTARERIGSIVRYHLRWTAENANLSLYLTRVGMADGAPEPTQRVAKLNHDFFTTLQEWLAPFIASGELVAAPPEIYVSLVIGPASHFARHWLAHRMKLEVASVIEPLAQAAWNAVRAR
jgi:AcrR family transcriptional regulator